MGKRLGSRLGSRIGGGSSPSTSNLSNLLSDRSIDILDMSIPLVMIEDDIDFIKAGTPVRSGKLINSYGINDGNIVSSAPYVQSVESVHHMIRDSETSIMSALIDRAIDEIERQTPLNNIPTPIGTITIKVG